MSKSNSWENKLLELLFKNNAATAIGDAGGLLPSAADGNLYISLHTADPGEAGTQTTSEATYTSYARVAVPRDGVEWTVTANLAENTNLIAFPACTGGTNTITYFGIGTNPTTAGVLLYSGAFGTPLSVSLGIVPQIAAGDINVLED